LFRPVALFAIAVGRLAETGRLTVISGRLTGRTGRLAVSRGRASADVPPQPLFSARTAISGPGLWRVGGNGYICSRKPRPPFAARRPACPDGGGARGRND